MVQVPCYPGESEKKYIEVNKSLQVNLILVIQMIQVRISKHNEYYCKVFNNF